MAETWIEKKAIRGTKKKGNYQEVTVKYRIDADFIPNDISEISEEFIDNYCEANNEINWLIEMVNTKVPTKNLDENGNPKKVFMPFVNLRSEFAKKFFPSIIKGEGKKTETLRDRLNKKYGNK